MDGAANRYRGAAALAAVLVSALVAACGGSASGIKSASTSGLSKQYVVAVKYAHCMRADGVSNFPDPHNPGGFSESAIDALNVRAPAYISAAGKCAHLLPNGGLPTASGSEQRLENGVKVAKCMRKHGVYMPDPTLQPNGQLEINMAHVNANDPRAGPVGNLCEKQVFGYN